MAWFGFAIMATLLMTLVNFGDKFIIESQIPNPMAVLIFFSIFNLLTAAILWVLTGFTTLPQGQAWLLIAAGTAPAFAGYFYFQAVSRTEMTRIVIISQLAPIFTLVLSVIFTQDSINGRQLLGFVLILLAALAVTLQRAKPKVDAPLVPMWDVFGLMAAANFIAATSLVMTDSVVSAIAIDFQGLMLVTAYMGFGYFWGGLALLVLMPHVRQAFFRQWRITGRGALAAVGSVESIFVIRQFFLLQALILGPVAIVSVIGSLNVFFAVILGWVFTLWRPSIFKEDISTGSLMRKFIWAGVAFVGILLVR